MNTGQFPLLEFINVPLDNLKLSVPSMMLSILPFMYALLSVLTTFLQSHNF